jgi:hypothetical protein
MDTALVLAPPVRLRAFRRGTRRWDYLDPSPPRGSQAVTVSLGAGACRPSSAPRHGDPGSPSGLGRTQDRDLRVLAPGPASAVPPVRPVRSFAAQGSISVVPRTLDGTPSCCPTVRPRPFQRPQPKRPIALGRPGLGQRPPWPSTAVAWAHHAPCGAPLCDLGRIGLPHGRMEKSAAREGAGGEQPSKLPIRKVG